MEYNQDMKNRLKRIEGQVRGVLRMMEEGKDCREVITQLTASRAALDHYNWTCCWNEFRAMFA